MEKALIIIGVLVPSFFAFAIVAYVGARFMLWYFEPEEGSNEALRNWLLCHPGSDIEDYLNGVK